MGNGSDLNFDCVPGNADRVGPEFHNGRQCFHLAGSYIESGAVKGAFHALAVEVAFGKRSLLVGAHVACREVCGSNVEKSDRDAVHVGKHAGASR